MKNLLLVFLIVTNLQKISAQIVFCPPGAEWHYSYLSIPQWGGVMYYINETIAHVGDSINGIDTIKVISHRKYYLNCEDISVPLSYTSIRQRGDTVFFRNIKTKNNWQILYNFACTPGTGWQTSVYYSPNSQPIIYGFTVDSVKYTTINNHTLKVLVVGNQRITERLGWNSFLFNYHNDGNSGCDGFYFSDYLCYKDNTFGTKQFTTRPCNFSGIDGINELQQNNYFRIGPNPASDMLNVEFIDESLNYNTCQIEVLNLSGQQMITAPVQDPSLKLNISKLPSGLYILKMSHRSSVMAFSRFIKE